MKRLLTATAIAAITAAPAFADLHCTYDDSLMGEEPDLKTFGYVTNDKGEYVASIESDDVLLGHKKCEEPLSKLVCKTSRNLSDSVVFYEVEITKLVAEELYKTDVEAMVLMQDFTHIFSEVSATLKDGKLEDMWAYSTGANCVEATYELVPKTD